VAAYQKRNVHNQDLDEAAAMLRNWSGQVEIGQGAPFLIALAYQHLRTSVAENAAPTAGAAYQFQMDPAVLENLLRQRPAGWFGDYNELLLRVLVDAVEEGQRIQGRDLQRWRYGAHSQVTISNPVIHPIPWLGKYFDIGPVPMAGSSTTLKQTTTLLAPSMRMNADLSDWDRSLLNIQTGQSGQILSSHFRDQWPDYYYARSYPMQFRNVQAASRLEFRP
jgi:penicillin amidase